MKQMYKVFIDSLPVYFVKKEAEIKNIFVGNRTFYHVEKSDILFTLRKIIDFKLDTVDEVVFVCVKLEEVWAAFVQGYQLRIAAGGLVRNIKGEFLMIFRNGVWDLPKGHVELNESIENGAVREVEEECGITAPKITESLIVTYHTYEYKEQQVLKENHWFSMSYFENEKLMPQLEEGITRVEWKSRDEVKECLLNSYGSIQDVFKACI